MITHISIIIPIYNSSKYLINCLNSIAKQSYKEFELILINDCSTDNSEQLIHTFMKEHPTISCRLISHVHNSGQSVARNNGIKEAKGEYLLFVDSDDTLSEDCLESMINLATKEELDLVIGENYIISENGTKRMITTKLNGIIKDNKKILSAFVQGLWYNPPWNKLIRTDFIRENNLYFKEGYIFEDELWSFCLASKVQSMGVVKAPLYNYYIRPNSTMTSNKDFKRWNGMAKILPFMREFINNEGLYSNMEVGRFFMIKIIQTISGLNNATRLNCQEFNQLTCLNIHSPHTLYKQGYLSYKELLGYLYFQLPRYISYLYYQGTCLYYKLK